MKKIWIPIIVVLIIIVAVAVFYKPVPKGTIKIGAILPLTGKVASPGQDLKNALDLASSDINKNKNLIELIYEDDQCDAQKAVEAYNSLVNANGVKIIVGALCSPSTLAIAPLAEKDKVILITPASAAESISNAGDFIFRNHTKDSDEARALANFILKKGYKNLAIMYSISNESTIQRKGYFSKYLQEGGGAVKIEVPFSDDQRDFATELTKIKSKEKEIDAIYLIVPIAAVPARIVKQMAELGIQKQVFGDKSWATSEFLNSVGKLSEGIIYAEAEFNRSTSPEFWDRYKEKFNKEPASWAAQGYDSLMILNQIIFNKKCGIDTICIKDGLYKVKNYPGAAGLTSFDANGDAIKIIAIKIIKNGQFVPYEK